MNEKLQDKVVAIELAGNNIFIANDNDNFKNERNHPKLAY